MNKERTIPLTQKVFDRLGITEFTAQQIQSAISNDNRYVLDEFRNVMNRALRSIPRSKLMSFYENYCN